MEKIKDGEGKGLRR